MFASLRSRLWLSYALVTFTALALTLVILFVYLLRNPLAYRQNLNQMRSVETSLLASHPDLANLPAATVQSILETYDQVYAVRLVLFDSEGQVLADSQAGSSPGLTLPAQPRLSRTGTNLRDAAGNPWIFLVTRLGEEQWLLLASPRPRVALFAILRDELLRPFIQAGLVALLFSLFLAFWLARWIGDPLGKIVAASRRMPGEEAAHLDLRGPREVQELTRAFNEMTTRVRASRQSQRDFVANVSHELKTPLTSIQGFAQAVLDGTAHTQAEIRQSASVIHDEAGRMHRLVLDLLDLARLDAGTLELQRSPLDLAALLKDTLEKFTPLAKQAGIRLELEASGLPPLVGDGDRLAQVFANLLDNAVRFTPGGGSISIYGRQAGDRILIDVTDTGTGIPVEAQAHIFERFFQVDAAGESGMKHGAGLGLAIVKEILQAHGGTITVRSTPGQGSTFTVSLPVVLPGDETAAARRK